MIREWASDNPRGAINIPPERTATQRYRWFVAQQKEVSGLVGTCAAYELLLNGVQLTDVLVDTSERFQGTVMRKRVTHRDELILVHTSVVIFRLQAEEADDKGSRP